MLGDIYSVDKLERFLVCTKGADICSDEGNKKTETVVVSVFFVVAEPIS